MIRDTRQARRIKEDSIGKEATVLRQRLGAEFVEFLVSVAKGFFPGSWLGSLRRRGCCRCCLELFGAQVSRLVRNMLKYFNIEPGRVCRTCELWHCPKDLAACVNG